MAKLTTLRPRLQAVTTKAIGEDTHQPKARWGSGRGGRPWRRKRLQVFERDRYICQTCYRVCMSPECDHIVPVSQGGSDDMSNLATICIECHRDKTSKEAEAGKYNQTLY